MWPEMYLEFSHFGAHLFCHPPFHLDKHQFLKVKINFIHIDMDEKEKLIQ